MATIKINAPADMTPELAAKIFAWGLGVADTVVTASDRKVRLGDLTVAGVHYIASYGCRKSLQDSVSGVKDAIAKAAKESDGKAFAKFTAESGAGPSDVESVTERVLALRSSKRFDAIVASSIPVREESGRLSGRDRWIKTTATAEIAAIFAAHGKEMPSGDTLAAKVAKYTAANADRLGGLWDTYQAGLATVAASADSILDD